MKQTLSTYVPPALPPLAHRAAATYTGANLLYAPAACGAGNGPQVSIAQFPHRITCPYCIEGVPLPNRECRDCGRRHSGGCQ